MKSLTSIVLVLVTAFILSSCRDTLELYIDDVIEAQDEGAEILNEIADGVDVEENIERLKYWAEDMRNLIKRRENLEESRDRTDEDEKTLERREDDLMSAFEKLSQAVYRAEHSRHGPRVKLIIKDLF